MKKIESPTDVAFRTEVPTGAKTAALPAEISVQTLGRLTDAEEANVIDCFSKQIASMSDRLNHQAAAEGDDALQVAMDNAQVLWQKAKLECAIIRIHEHSYVTTETSKVPPPSAEGFEQVLHGPAGSIGGKWADMTVYVPLSDPKMSEATEYYYTRYKEYWDQFVTRFNSRSYEDRKSLIDRNDEADWQRSGGKPRGDKLTVEEIDRFLLKGPILIDRKSYTLTRR